MMVLPVDDSIAKPEYGPRVIVAVMCCYAFLSGLFGVVGYMYGLGQCQKDAGSVVTDCLPTDALTTVVRLSLASAMIISYPIILYPVSEIAEQSIFPCEEPSPTRRNFLRYAQVALTVAVASFCQNFSVFSDIVGTIMVPIAGFVLPPLVFAKLYRDRMNVSDKVHSLILLLLGPLLLALGIYSLISE
eukprot:gnl/MRDRNA2_/MRDRNA2_77435_c0_seq3.p1 gnl/MRDRNA2_/MRDRNA2_77435_c0~~gnl/MRDRNA2_/MRDRNA2_77435_c0_seq3.p1  ORF type:complete len:188 (+),score=18.09 gnl/MRDRNA2_/MRDRNA2_77435_c0_seq3:67-630(+)